MTIASTPRRRAERPMSLDNGKPVEQFASDRACTSPGCATRLSRYNPNGTCATHGGWADDPSRRSRDLL